MIVKYNNIIKEEFQIKFQKIEKIYITQKKTKYFFK